MLQIKKDDLFKYAKVSNIKIIYKFCKLIFLFKERYSINKSEFGKFLMI